jgi:hypothetical protein
MRLSLTHRAPWDARTLPMSSPTLFSHNTSQWNCARAKSPTRAHASHHPASPKWPTASVEQLKCLSSKTGRTPGGRGKRAAIEIDCRPNGSVVSCTARAHEPKPGRASFCVELGHHACRTCTHYGRDHASCTAHTSGGREPLKWTNSLAMTQQLNNQCAIRERCLSSF